MSPHRGKVASVFARSHFVPLKPLYIGGEGEREENNPEKRKGALMKREHAKSRAKKHQSSQPEGVELFCSEKLSTSAGESRNSCHCLHEHRREAPRAISCIVRSHAGQTCGKHRPRWLCPPFTSTRSERITELVWKGP